MATFDDAYQEWEGLMLSKQAATLLRRGMLGDGNGVVNVPGRPGWSWIRYSEEQSKLSQVRNVLFGYAADGTPVVVGKAHADDDYEQVLRADWAPYMQHLTPDRISQYAVAPHGDTHHGTYGNDPSYIDLNNIVVGKVIPTDPASLSVYVEAFVYAYGTDLETFPGGAIDLTASVPGAGLHRYVLVYLTMVTGALGLTDGVTVPLPVDAEIPDATNGTIPLGIVELEAGQTEIVVANIWQYKVIWCGIGYTGVHTHTDDASGGSSIIDLEELIFECAEPLFLMGNAIWPVNTYHSLYIESMYISGLVAEADLTWIHADPIHGCGQILIIRPVAPDMYTSYKINVRHGVGNIYLMGETDITLDERTDHLTLIYDGESWCEILPTWGHDGDGWVSSMDVRLDSGNLNLYDSDVGLHGMSRIVTDVILDDNAGDSPAIHWIPENDDIWTIFAENDATPGNSDLVVTMPADARFIWRDSLTPTDVAYIDAAGNADFLGHMAVGGTAAVSANYPLLVQEATTIVGGVFRGIHGQVDYNPAGAFNAIVMGTRGTVLIGTAQNCTGGPVVGVYGNVSVLDTVAATNVRIVGGYFVTDVEDATATFAIGLEVETPYVDNGLCAAGYGIRISQGTVGAGAITTLVGLRIYPITAGATNYAIYSSGGVSYHAGRWGVGVVPLRQLHTQVADTETAVVTYVERTGHTTSNVAAALFGVGEEHSLEDGGGAMQVASEVVTLWATATAGAESPLRRWTTYPAGVAGPGYSGFWTFTGIDAGGVTVVPNGAGDVPSGLIGMYRLTESGGGIDANTIMINNGANVDLYDDGVDVCTLTCNADGSVTIARSAGAATFAVSILLCWL